MAVVVLADTGPLVALFDRKQKDHAWVAAAVRGFGDPLLTCDAVVTEATHLLRPGTPACMALVEAVERGAVVSRFELQSHVQRVRALMQRYANVPMSFADACLVRLTELHADVLVWTLDSDFRIYRRHGRQAIPTLMPRR